MNLKTAKPKVIIISDGVPIMAQGLVAMADLLRSNHIDCSVRNLWTERRAGKEAPLTGWTEGATIAGISIQWFYQIPLSLKLAKEIKNLSPSTFVVAGGMTAGFFAEEIIANHIEFDGVIKGDGEIPLLNLCYQLKRKKPDLDEIPNLTYRTRKGKVKNSHAKFYVAGPRQLNSLNFSNFSLLENKGSYIANSSWREITDRSIDINFDISSTFYICGGRGCSVNCIFCGGGKRAHFLHSGRRKVIFRSPAATVEDVSRALKYGFSSIHACFDPFPHGKQWFEFCRLIKNKGIRTNFIFESFSLPSEKFLQCLKETFPNCIVVISPETSIEKIRKKAKGFFFTNRELESTCQQAEKLKIPFQLFFGYFLPDDDETTIERNMEYIYTLRKRFPDHVTVFYYPYSTDPASPIMVNPRRYKMSCDTKTFNNYLKALSRADQLKGNLLSHLPIQHNREYYELLSLRIEMEEALKRNVPEVAHRIRQRHQQRTFYEIARRISGKIKVNEIRRPQLHNLFLNFFNEK